MQFFQRPLPLLIIIILIIIIIQPMSQKRYGFTVQWFDTQSSVLKKFYFFYYLPEEQIQMYDLKNQKTFLKKIKYPDVTLGDLFIGSVFTCYNRQLKVVGYADQYTRKLFEAEVGRTYGMIKPNAYLNIGKIISATQKQFQIANLRMFKMRKQDAEEFYAEHKGKGFFPTLMEFITSDYVVGMELISMDAIKKWRDFIGPTKLAEAKEKSPNSMRALYGQSDTKNACHGSDAPQTAQREINFVFGNSSKLQPTALLTNSTLCIIHPHIVKSKQVGEIINMILEAGFEISALQMVFLDLESSKQFYDVYSFLPEYQKIIEHSINGPSIAIEVRHEEPVLPFKELCGPFDPEIARKLRPDSIRAKFGIDRTRNAVHCTDLVEDGRLECEYFFRTLLG